MKSSASHPHQSLTAVVGVFPALRDKSGVSPNLNRHIPLSIPFISSETYDKLPDRLIGLHQPMRLPNVLKAKHSGWLRLIAACRHLFGNGLKRNVREGKLWRAEHEAAEEGKVDATCHLQEWVEIGDRIETTQPSS